ncbi:uncharacterized protein LOC131673122 isoform X2 [Phymastichus coffea]|uniref:uncharacterized protein LOC131673122 isoform X2 n=1 Tax=Phymastichus coffea TaxID=108790 RepID=UPI00273AE55D|nr:uncharacterized protein LOC131673122 isoform X2 [Phymastichus coffea]
MVKEKDRNTTLTNQPSKLLLIGILISGFICSARTECSDIARIAIIMNLNSDFCKESLLEREFSSNSEEYSIYKSNHTISDRYIEIMFLDTCGSTEESIRLVFKVISWFSLNCLRAPYFLGFIGPEDIQSLEASVKITAPLQIPYITKFSTSLPHVHYLTPQEDLPLLQIVIELINDLKWKSFVFEANTHSLFQKLFVQQFLEKSFLKNLCILPSSEISAPIVYIGDINSYYLNSVNNSTILVVGGHNIEQKLVHIHSTNLLLFLTDTRKEQTFSANTDSLNYPHNGSNIAMNKSNFIFNAVNVYSKALRHLCKSESCYSAIETGKWNDYIVRALSTEKIKESYEYILKIKDKNKDIQVIGRLSNNNNKYEVEWGIRSPTILSQSNNFLDSILDRLRKKLDDKKKAICMTSTEVYKQINLINKNEKNIMVKSELTAAEWWTMVGTVVGVGIAMFTVGFFAVYIVYTNIRAPQLKRSSEKLGFERDSSLRRVGSDKEIRSFNTNGNHRLTSAVQRRDSKTSIRSNISDKSV